MSSRDEYDAIIVGGGFYGCLLAIHLRKSGAESVLLMERESSILQRASYANQCSQSDCAPYGDCSEEKGGHHVKSI